MALLTCACVGPAASDAEVCRDTIARLCAPEVCAAVAPLVPAQQPCEAALTAQSGCNDDAFAFTQPSREGFLKCRLPLLRASVKTAAHPNCEDVNESFDRCPDFRRVFQEKP